MWESVCLSLHRNVITKQNIWLVCFSELPIQVFCLSYFFVTDSSFTKITLETILYFFTITCLSQNHDVLSKMMNLNGVSGICMVLFDIQQVDSRSYLVTNGDLVFAVRALRLQTQHFLRSDTQSHQPFSLSKAIFFWIKSIFECVVAISAYILSKHFVIFSRKVLKKHHYQKYYLFEHICVCMYIII